MTLLSVAKLAPNPSLQPTCYGLRPSHAAEIKRYAAQRRARRYWHNCSMDFEIVGEITVLETIATGQGIRDLKRLRRSYGKGRWRKMKGIARIRLRSGHLRLAEIHWYEAHGVGKREFKRKHYLDE